ncbi:MAG: hypothetical protein OHK0012_00990 [Synechococcales cyanobacterium]
MDLTRRSLLHWAAMAAMSPWLGRSGGRRTALILGLSQYPEPLPPLSGSLVDVQLWEHLLTRWGWDDWQTLVNPGREQARQALQQEWTLIHISGYGDGQSLWFADGQLLWTDVLAATSAWVSLDLRPVPNGGVPVALDLPRGSGLARLAPELGGVGSLTPTLTSILWLSDVVPVLLPHSQRWGAGKRGLASDLRPSSALVDAQHQVWLGGIPPTALAVWQPGSQLRLVGGEQMYTLRERQGWVGKVMPSDGLTPGSLLVETRRVLPSRLTVNVGFGTHLDRIERVDLTNALASVPWVAISESGPRDCLVERHTGYGLLNAFGDPWTPSFSDQEEALTTAVQRLLPRLRALLAIKKLHSLLTPASTHLRVQLTVSSDSLSLEAQREPGWMLTCLDWDPQGILHLYLGIPDNRSRVDLSRPPAPGLHELFILATPPLPPLRASLDKLSGNSLGTGWIPLPQPWEWVMTLQEILSQPGRDPETRQWSLDDFALASLYY